MTCKDCIHMMVCDNLIRTDLPYADGKFPAELYCLDFCDKADFVGVVRCEECKYYYTYYHRCQRDKLRIKMKCDDYCSYGRRKDNGGCNDISEDL